MSWVDSLRETPLPKVYKKDWKQEKSRPAGISAPSLITSRGEEGRNRERVLGSCREAWSTVGSPVLQCLRPCHIGNGSYAPLFHKPEFLSSTRDISGGSYTPGGTDYCGTFILKEKEVKGIYCDNCSVLSVQFVI